VCIEQRQRVAIQITHTPAGIHERRDASVNGDRSQFPKAHVSESLDHRGDRTGRDHEPLARSTGEEKLALEKQCNFIAELEADI
jgi:hypothetical protein